MSKAKNNAKSKDATAKGNTFVVWFGVVAITIAVSAGLATQPNHVNRDASSSAVQQVEGGAR